MKNTDDIFAELKQAQQQILGYMQAHSRLFFFEGLLFILFGFAAIIVPQVFGVVIVIFLGWLIVFGGLIHVSRALFFKNMPDFGLWLLLGVLQVFVGYLLIADPIAGILTLTMMMTLFFAIEGIIKIYLALIMRPLPDWNYVLFSGITALILAAVILVFWSGTALWLLGFFLGVNMLVLGGTMVKMSLTHKESQM